jgi:uncharacterized protein
MRARAHGPGDPGKEPAYQVVVMAKAPVAGEVKTRLCPPLSLTDAARLATMSLMDTLDAVAGAGPARQVVALAGSPGLWLRDDFTWIEQVGDGLGHRIESALSVVWSTETLPVLVIGMDTPQLRPDDIAAAARILLSDGVEAVLGPASDGGYWCLGLRAPVEAPCRDVTMSSDRTFDLQLARLTKLGLRCALLPEQRDVDEIDDALAVSVLAPESRFAAALAGLDFESAFAPAHSSPCHDRYGPKR